MTGREFSHWLFEEQNWRWVLAIPMAAVIIPALVYSFATMDDDLWYRDRRDKIADSFELELKSLALPGKTAINKREKISKQFSVLVYVRYRTELPPNEFKETLDLELRRGGWIQTSSENDGKFTTFDYCRGKFDASLSYENSRGIWADGGDYWRIDFSFGLRSRSIFTPFPEGCR